MGSIGACTAAYALYTSVHELHYASAIIIGTCMVVQTTDSMSFVLIELFGFSYWAKIRARINEKKDAFEDRCVDSAADLIASTRTLAAMTARNARRVMHSTGKHGSGVADVPLGNGEK